MYRFFILFLAPATKLVAEGNHFSNFVRASPKKHFSEIILKSGH